MGKDKIFECEMLVKERMSHPVITIHPDMPIQEAQANVRTRPAVSGG
jgi:hypothetical protein